MTKRRPEATTETSAEDLWTPLDVAKYLKVSRSWVYLHSESGDLPVIRVGALLRFEPSKVRAWVQSKAT